MSDFDIKAYMDQTHDPRHLGLVLPHLAPSEFTNALHEREYPFRFGFNMGWGFQQEEAYEAYRKHAVGYCDVREDLPRFSIDSSRINDMVAVMFEDEIGRFWFHMQYLTTCVIDADLLEEAESLYAKTKVYKTRPGKYGDALSLDEILDGGYAWQYGIDEREEPLFLDEAIKLENGAWVNKSSLPSQ